MNLDSGSEITIVLSNSITGDKVVKKVKAESYASEGCSSSLNKWYYDTVMPEMTLSYTLPSGTELSSVAYAELYTGDKVVGKGKAKGTKIILNERLAVGDYQLRIVDGADVYECGIAAVVLPERKRIGNVYVVNRYSDISGDTYQIEVETKGLSSDEIKISIGNTNTEVLSCEQFSEGTYRYILKTVDDSEAALGFTGGFSPVVIPTHDIIIETDNQKIVRQSMKSITSGPFFSAYHDSVNKSIVVTTNVEDGTTVTAFQNCYYDGMGRPNVSDDTYSMTAVVKDGKAVFKYTESDKNTGLWKNDNGNFNHDIVVVVGDKSEATGLLSDTWGLSVRCARFTEITHNPFTYVYYNDGYYLPVLGVKKTDGTTMICGGVYTSFNEGDKYKLVSDDGLVESEEVVVSAEDVKNKKITFNVNFSDAESCRLYKYYAKSDNSDAGFRKKEEVTLLAPGEDICYAGFWDYLNERAAFRIDMVGLASENGIVKYNINDFSMHNEVTDIINGLKFNVTDSFGNPTDIKIACSGGTKFILYGDLKNDGTDYIIHVMNNGKEVKNFYPYELVAESSYNRDDVEISNDCTAMYTVDSATLEIREIDSTQAVKSIELKKGWNYYTKEQLEGLIFDSGEKCYDLVVVDSNGVILDEERRVFLKSSTNGYKPLTEVTVKDTEDVKEPDDEKGTDGVVLGDDGEYYYYKDGVVSDYTGLATYGELKMYFVNGVHDKKFNGFVQEGDNWLCIADGNAASTYTGLWSDETVGWWYVKDGMIDFTRNGFELFNDTWWCVAGGRVCFDYTGLWGDETVGWWYVKDGMIDFTRNGFDFFNDIWWCVAGGRVCFEYTGLWSDEQLGWWYVENGLINFAANKIVPLGDAWWCVAGGKVCFDYTGLWYDESVGWWYIENGTINFNYNGVVDYNGASYNVAGGMVIFG